LEGKERGYIFALRKRKRGVVDRACGVGREEGEREGIINLVDNKKAITFALPKRGIGSKADTESSLKV